MTSFSRTPTGEIRAHFDVVERGLLTNLADQLVTLLEHAETAGTDPALERLIPDAYRDDAEAAAEFRRLTASDLAAHKIDNARTVIESVRTARHSSVILDAAAVQAWLRTLTDIRLTLAARLGIVSDDDEGRTDHEAIPMHQLYLWCGYLQESLLEVLD